ncbi:MAG: DinB family protein [Isosphaeraceae bacterium]
MSFDAPSARIVASTVRAGFRDVHDKIREITGALDADALNWKPHPEANSIAVLVTHTLGSEREMLAAVRGIKLERDRPSEFRVESGAKDLAALIDRADADLDEHTAAITAEDLTAPRARGDREPRPGFEWLLTNYGHAREHLAQIELTLQLYRDRSAS